MYDAHIVGGGPAGCFAGIAALQQGKNVLLSEEHSQIGKPEACSGLVSESGLDSLLPYVDYRKVVLNRIMLAKITAGNQAFTIRPREEHAILVSRCGLDQLAADRFVSEGGKLELGKKVTRGFASKNVVGADGPASAVAEHFGFPKIGSFVACMQGDFAYSCEDSNQAEIFVSAQDFPGFFGWAIPINEEQAKIGVGVSLPHHPLKFYRRFLARLGVKSISKNEFAAVIPTSVRKKTAMRKGDYSVLLAGDSAGQVKATTGGGIFFGASCGLIAGRSFSEPEAYERRWRQAFGLDLLLHSHFRFLLNIGKGEPNRLLLSAAKAMLFEDLLSERGRMDRWGRMLSPSLLASYGSVVARKIMGGAR